MVTSRWTNSGLKLTKRQEHILFLKGALNAVTKTHQPPADREAMRHFLEGSQAVHQGIIVINDIDAMRDFIGDVQSGKWPPKLPSAISDRLRDARLD